MRPKQRKATKDGDLFRARLDQIIDLKHELVQLAGALDWEWLDDEIAVSYSEKGRPGIETRFVIGLLLLKHIYGLSDDVVYWSRVQDHHFLQFHRGSCGGRALVGSAGGRRTSEQGSQAGHSGHHGAAQGHHLPDRRQASARGD